MEQIHSGPMTGRTVLVTGGSGGIGRATALGLAAMGAHLAITGRDRGRTEDAAREIRAAGSRQVDVFVADLSSLSQVRRLADEVLQMSSMRKTALVAGIFARFDAFGMYTRRTARGFHDVMDWCTRTATSALASGVRATSPSIPAVLRPALRCVTCRTLTSVLARDRSISFCRFLTLGQSCSCAALKIRCRSRRTCPSCSRQPILSHSAGASRSRGWPSGPFALGAAATSATAGRTQVRPSHTGVEKL